MNNKGFFIFTKQEKRGIVVLLIFILIAVIFPNLYRMYFTNIDKESCCISDSCFKLKGNNSVLRNSLVFDSGRKKETLKPTTFNDKSMVLNETQKVKEYLSSELCRNKKTERTKFDTIKPALKKDKVKKAKNIRIKVELNTADTTDLKKVYGIGSWYANKIVRYRERLGGFFTVQQLKEIKMRKGTYERISPQLYTDTSHIVKIDLDTISFRNLLRHPYFNYDMVKKVFYFRKKQGNVFIQDLFMDGTISQNQLVKIKKYCKNT